ncbi:MAG: DinB family protein [Bacteroidetes bacterium]|nr:DinB family protein [Bacteroidota bacterium]MBS1541114.1 DinB family protein [Bacteroidota bacterium]
MLKEGLINEFLHETENTRKLLKAIPDAALNWKPAEKSWTTAQLASHIAGLYDWYDKVINLDDFALDAYHYDRGDLSKAANIVAKFEENAERAQRALENFDESTAKRPWQMTMRGHEAIAPTPKIVIIRSVLFNHVYHHRGELVVYLRATGHKVPGLYGPTAEGTR